jgi:hypothetical protein
MLFDECWSLGTDWEKAKTQAEVRFLSCGVTALSHAKHDDKCLDYLFEIGVKMRCAGLSTV